MTVRVKCLHCGRPARVRKVDRRVVWHRRRGRRWCEGSVAILAKP